MNKLTVHCDDELFDDYESEVTVDVTQALVERAERGQALLEGQSEFWRIECFDYSVSWGQRTECDSLEVSKDSVQWSAFIKYTNIRIATESLSLAELKELV